MKTVIVGQGAIGLLCYHRFSQFTENKQANKLVSLLPSTAPSFTDYYFSEMNEEAHKFPLNIANNQALTHAHIIILCVKSYQVTTALKAIHHLLKDNAIIILAHNGLGTFEEISPLLKPSQCLLALLLTQGAKKVADYHVEHTGIGNSDLGIVWGELDAKNKKQLLNYFQHSLKQINWQEDIQQAQWKKLAINCVINPISALENINNGEINIQVYQDKIKSIISEVVAIANKEGVVLTEHLLLNLVRNVAEGTAKNTSSMRADVLNKRRTEIDYINGYIDRLAKKHQLTTTVNSQLWLAVKTLEKRYLSQ